MNYEMPGKILDTVKEVNFANMRNGYIKQEGSFMHLNLQIHHTQKLSLEKGLRFCHLKSSFSVLMTQMH